LQALRFVTSTVAKIAPLFMRQESIEVALALFVFDDLRRSGSKAIAHTLAEANEFGKFGDDASDSVSERVTRRDASTPGMPIDPNNLDWIEQEQKQAPTMTWPRAHHRNQG
jgi:hypothetical protein